MPPTIYLVRHAEGENNIQDSHWIRDAVLTDKGKEQCKILRRDFPYHKYIDIVMASPLRRAIQTASIAFGPTIARPEVPFLLVPMAHEKSGKHCDIGHPRSEIEKQVPDLLAGQDLGFDPSKIDFSLVEDGWNSKTGIWAPDHESVMKRAAILRTWLYQRPERRILLVTHGAFLHYFTEDWTGDDPIRGTAYLNCECRIFDFTPDSNEKEAHILETEENKKARVRPTENIPTMQPSIVPN